MALELTEVAAKILFVVVFFSLCIFVHEFGHLLAALWRGLYVQRFSIGFGPRLWGKRRGQVDYAVSAIPFGGYVALPQLDPTAEPKTETGEVLPRGSPVSRMLTAVSGPLANVVFGFLLALFVWWFGIHKPAPAPYCDVSLVPEGTPEYEAGLRPGDRIVAVNGRGFVRGWEELSHTIVLTPGRVVLRVRRGDQELDIRYRPAPNPEVEGLGFPFFRVLVPIVVHRVVPRSPAEAAGVRAGDRILRVDGQPVLDTDEFIIKVRDSRGAPLQLLIDRAGREMIIPEVRAAPEKVGSEIVYRIGVHFGIFVLVHPTPWAQFVNVFVQTRDTVRSLFTRGSLVKPRHVSGPVGIVQMIWAKVRYGGFRDGLAFIVFVTFSLAFVNLLPVPVLDGGHVLLALIELGSRRCVPVRIAYALQNAFAVLIIAFFLYVTFFDVVRISRFSRLVREASADRAEPSAAPAPAVRPGAERGK